DFEVVLQAEQAQAAPRGAFHLAGDDAEAVALPLERAQHVLDSVERADQQIVALALKRPVRGAHLTGPGFGVRRAFLARHLTECGRQGAPERRDERLTRRRAA